MVNIIEISKRMGAFESWFTTQGGYVHPSTELIYEASRGIQLRVKSRTHLDYVTKETVVLPKGTVVISCPHSLSLSALNARGFPPFFPASGNDKSTANVLFRHLLQKGARPQCIAALLLVVEHHNSHVSRWKDYLNMLPAAPTSHNDDRSGEKLWELDSPLWWDEDELRMIRGTNLDKGRKDLQAMWKAEWERWKPYVHEFNEDAAREITWEDFKWAMSILGSRAFSSSQIANMKSSQGNNTVLAEYNPDMLLYPGIDSLNHNPLSRNRWYSDEERFGIICDDEPHAGEEIWNPYGGKSNGELMLSYGFCLPNNPCDTFALKLAQLPPPFLFHQRSRTDCSSTRNRSDNLTENGPSPMTPHNKPPALSVQHNTYFIRPQPRFYVPDTEYPSQQDDYAHLRGIPNLLLSSLACSVANGRERQHIQHEMKAGTTELQSVWSPLGCRNICAVTYLLYARLNMELDRLEALPDGQSIGPASESIPRNKARHAERIELVHTYLEDQRQILEINIQLMEMYLRRKLNDGILLGQSRVESSSTSLQHGVQMEQSALVTLSQAISMLQELDDRTCIALLAGLQILYGTQTIEDILQDFPDDAENIWVMFFAVTALLLASSEVHENFQTDDGHNRNAVATNQRPGNQLGRWFVHFDGIGYSVLSSATDAISHRAASHSEENVSISDKTENTQQAELVSHIQTCIHTVHESLLESGDDEFVSTFDTSRFTANLIRACVSIINEETLRISLRKRASRFGLGTGAENSGGSIENIQVCLHVGDKNNGQR